jgi:hypothetical protein
MSYKKDNKRISNDFEKEVITRPIIVKQTSNVVNRIKSASVRKFFNKLIN